MKSLAVLLVLISSVVTFSIAQDIPPPPPPPRKKNLYPRLEREDPIFMIVEQRATYPGGYKAYDQFIKKNLKYPAEAKRLKKQGRVTVSFVVEKDGSLTDVKILRGLGAGCDEEALRLVKLMPKWIPARQRGQKVRFRHMLPVLFEL